MVTDQMNGVLLNLLQLTESKKLNWKPLSALDSHVVLMSEYMQCNKYSQFNSDLKIIDYSLNSSYFISHRDGFFILADFLCQSCSDSPIYHKLRMLTKINDYLSITDVGYNEDCDDKLELLKLYIERNISKEYSQPDTLYNFWDSLSNLY